MNIIPPRKDEKYYTYSLKSGKNLLKYVMVHSHLMFKSVLNENLGGILGGTQC
jgi:hypothetical protein